MQQQILGHIEGLLEAWAGRGYRQLWREIELSNKQKARLVELFNTLSSSFIVTEMQSGAPSTKTLLSYLALLEMSNRGG